MTAMHLTENSEPEEFDGTQPAVQCCWTGWDLLDEKKRARAEVSAGFSVSKAFGFMGITVFNSRPLVVIGFVFAIRQFEFGRPVNGTTPCVSGATLVESFPYNIVQ
ncbi:hypothetical protein BJ741DRAFT_575052 [Chytriomyces cf. hyalinus JEL632]|nr:hypothetical protein BJ741DRAFT_575052 [Chytriomyces cf. hyalinus JEL632]